MEQRSELHHRQVTAPVVPRVLFAMSAGGSTESVFDFRDLRTCRLQRHQADDLSSQARKSIEQDTDTDRA